ncbi:MAG: hypothetical protein ACREU4_13930 [Burkholderiales bacterium]
MVQERYGALELGRGRGRTGDREIDFTKTVGLRRILARNGTRREGGGPEYEEEERAASPHRM